VRLAGFLIALTTALAAQDGQSGPRPGWPCVAGRAVDPSYIEIAESSGGQLFLFQKGEVAQSGPVMSASFTHPSTILRAVGQLSGTREFEFPVESGTASILVMASLQCRNAIDVKRPGGGEMIAANSAQSTDLKAGKILRVDSPESGKWSVKLTGTGLFVLSVAAKAQISLGSVSIKDQGTILEARVGGEAANIRFHILGAGGENLVDLELAEPVEPGFYRMPVKPPAERFRVAVTGTDSMAATFQRTWPNLFRASTLK
jgi:hypothetical protein